MSTLGELKLEIQAETGRDDWAETTDLPTSATPIALSINRAIRKHQHRPLWFCFRRNETFDTVAGQAWYGATDASFIPEYFKVQRVFLRANGQTIERQLAHEHIGELSEAIARAGSTSVPHCFAISGEEIALYHVPDAVHRVRFEGYRTVAAPASDIETGNAWMVHAYDLIKHQAMAHLFGQYEENMEDEGKHLSLAAQELEDLRAETDRRHATGRVVPTEF